HPLSMPFLWLLRFLAFSPCAISSTKGEGLPTPWRRAPEMNAFHNTDTSACKEHFFRPRMSGSHLQHRDRDEVCLDPDTARTPYPAHVLMRVPTDRRRSSLSRRQARPG